MTAASELGARPPATPGPAGRTDDDRRDDDVVGGNGANGEAGEPADAAGGEGNGAAPAPAVTGADARARWWRDPIVLVAAAVVLVPSIVAAVSALRNPWIPTNDWALIELRVREVGTGDTPLVGPWSRFGWRHPGPLMFYVLALPYRLVSADRGLLFATACVNLAATIGFALVVLRHSRSRAIVALVGLAVVQRGMGIDQLSDPWNPTILLVPFALYVVLCIEIATGRQRWPIAVAAGVASFVVQSHVGLVQPVLLLGVVAFGLRWYFGRRDGVVGTEGSDLPAWRRLPWRPLVPTALVLGVTWLPVAIDQVNGSGNLGLLFRWSRGEDIGGGMGALTEGRLSAERVVNSAAWLLDPVGLWIGRFEPIMAFGSPLLGQGRPVTLLWVPLALGLALLAASRAPMSEAHRRSTVVAGALAAAGIVALFTDLATAEGSPVWYPFHWAAVVVMLIAVTVGWAVAGMAAQRFPWLDEVPEVPEVTEVGARRRVRPLRRLGALPAPVRLAGIGMVAAVAVPVALAAWRGPVGRQPVQPASEAMLRLRPAIEEYTAGEELVVANTVDLFNDKDLGLPVVLARAGIDWVEIDDPRAEGRMRYAILPASALESPTIAAVIATGRGEVLAWSGPPAATELVLVRSRVEALPEVPES